MVPACRRVHAASLCWPGRSMTDWDRAYDTCVCTCAGQRHGQQWVCMGRNAPSEACVRFCQDAVTVLGGPERQVFGWVMFRPKKLDFNQVNCMEKKDVCTAECCTGGLRPPAHPSSDTCPLRGQQAPSAPTTARYRDHWSRAGWSSLACGAGLDQVRGLAGALVLVRWLVTVS